MLTPLVQIRDLTRPTMWPFLFGFGVVNLAALKYLKFPDNLEDRHQSPYATAIDNHGKPNAHKHH